MMKILNPTDYDPQLAIGLGRFAQACVYLERQIEMALFRLLPVTHNIGCVLLSGNQMRRNLDIMKALTLLPDVPLSESLRDYIQDLCIRCNAINDDRSRLLHNPIATGDDGYMLVLHKQDGKGSALMPISTEFLIERTNQASELATELILKIPSLKYDTSEWVKRGVPHRVVYEAAREAFA